MKLLHCLLAAVCLLLVTTACDVDTDFVTGDAVQLRFSTDTLTFDTVFTAVGSATRQFTVYNDGEDPVKIDRISVAGETGVNYAFNVDGFSGPEARDVTIFAEDSIFVFVEVNVDPTEPEEFSPFIAEDRMLFETGSRTSDVTLIAFGQNANYINGFDRGEFDGLACGGGTFTLPVDLPTVIYGSYIIDDCTLEALAGTRIYFHGGVQRNDEVGGNGFFNDGILFVTETGKIDFRGTLDNPVILATDRLEERFLDDPAKYRGIILGPGSRGNRINHTQLLNAIAGVTVDSTAEITIDNSVIAYTGGPAVSAYNGDVTVRNSVFHSNFGNAVQFVLGGNLEMDYTTIANYGVDASSLVLTNFDCDADNNCIAAGMRARIRNSILSGSRGSELILLDISVPNPGANVPFDVTIDNSVVRTDQGFLNAQDGAFADFYERICTGCHNLAFSDLLFQSVEMDDYQLDSLSVARDLARPIDIAVDQLGVLRDGAMPDAGAFERVDR